MNSRENYLRAVEFRYPEWIPGSMNFAPIVWKTYRQDLEKIVLDHPRIFPDYTLDDRDFFDEMPPVYRQGEKYLDNWGCLWYNTQEGLEGQVIGHPLADWTALGGYRLPNPLVADERELEPKDWVKLQAEMAERRQAGRMCMGNGERLFDRLYFLRGFENLMLDFALEPPELPRLVARLEEYETALVQHWLKMDVSASGPVEGSATVKFSSGRHAESAENGNVGLSVPAPDDSRIDFMGFHTDFGMQTGLMISPRSFRKFIKPMFNRLFQMCRRAGVQVYLSSDGRLLEVVDDLIECGVSVHDPQLRANGLDGIVKAYKGRLCANVDLDRQSFAFITPQDLRRQVAEVVEAMYDPAGGLMLLAAVYDQNVPLANIVALCEAFEEFCFT